MIIQRKFLERIKNLLEMLVEEIKRELDKEPSSDYTTTS